MRRTGLIFASLLLTCTANPLLATPEFAVRYKQSCQLCHVIPTGGGMRALYGAQFFSYMDLPMEELADFAMVDSITPQIGKFFQLGVDFRRLFYWSDDPALSNSFLTMEGTLYTTIAPSDKTLVYISKGLYGNSFQAFVQFQGLPHAMVLRSGRFMPAYGWQFVDHNSYTRNYLGFGQGRGLDDGAEIGFYPMDWEASVAITNGGLPAITDADGGKSITTRAASRFSLLDANITAGLSWRYAQFKLGAGADPGPAGRYFGPFWGVNYGSITYLGEADWIIAASDQLAVTHYVTYQLRRGVYLSSQYDFYDPDLALANGFNWRGRLGADVFPTGYLELKPGFVWERIAGSERGTAELQLHVWF